MAYVLNINKGTEIVHPDIGLLESGTAKLIPDDLVNIAKNLRGVVVFDKIAGIDDNKVAKGLYGKDIEELKKKIDKTKNEEKLKYTDFVKKYKDAKIASRKWTEYKKEHGLE